MDIYGMQSSDFTCVDELLDFSNDQDNVLSTDILHQHHKITPSSTSNGCSFDYISNYNDYTATNYHHQSKDFTDDLCVPTDDVAELEWLSNFVHDSFINFPANNLTGTINHRPDHTTPYHINRSKINRTRTLTADKSTETESLVRRCTHCASEKTPQWRTGPLGPKTLCNACGVRYKSGRLVPEYRPAASPTFVLTQHSNSHRKVMELRRQKEVMQMYGGGERGNNNNIINNNNYEVR